MKPILLFVFLSFIVNFNSAAQCLPGEIALTMNIGVDAWGQETYWELVPTGNGCGNGTIAFGSSTNVGCAGIDPFDDSGYTDNTTVAEGPYCLVDGMSYDLIFVDSYGDGGLVFELYEDGSFSHNYIGAGDGNTWTFEVGNSGLPANDSPCGALEVIPDGAAIEMTNITAVAQSGEPTPLNGSCGIFGFWCEIGLSNTVWAYFTAAEGVSYDITTCNDGPGFDTQLAVYHSNDCADFSTFEMISSNDDMGGCAVANGYSSRMFASCLIPGDTYYIQLDGWAGAVGTAFLTVSTYEGTTNFNTQVNNVACPVDKGGISTGSIIPYFVGSGSNFTCEWTGPNGYESSENYVYELGPGTYNLTATTSCGEVFTDDFQIFQPETWSIVLSGTGPDCAASGNGSIALTVGGATAPYTYNWAGPDNFSSDIEDISALDFGSYQIIITDDNGCEQIQTYMLNPLDNFSFDLGNDTVICIYNEAIIYGPPGLDYLWQDGTINQFYELSGEDWSLGAHALILTATTDEGCTYSDAYIFTVDACAGVHEGAQESMMIYPNPVSDLIMISFETAKNKIDVRLYDAAGRLVENRNYNSGSNFRVDADLPAGVYSLNVIADNEYWVKTVLVGD